MAGGCGGPAPYPLLDLPVVYTRWAGGCLLVLRFAEPVAATARWQRQRLRQWSGVTGAAATGGELLRSIVLPVESLTCNW